ERKEAEADRPRAERRGRAHAGKGRRLAGDPERGAVGGPPGARDRGDEGERARGPPPRGGPRARDLAGGRGGPPGREARAAGRRGGRVGGGAGAARRAARGVPALDERAPVREAVERRRVELPPDGPPPLRRVRLRDDRRLARARPEAGALLPVPRERPR